MGCGTSEQKYGCALGACQGEREGERGNFCSSSSSKLSLTTVTQGQDEIPSPAACPAFASSAWEKKNRPGESFCFSLQPVGAIHAVLQLLCHWEKGGTQPGTCRDHYSEAQGGSSIYFRAPSALPAFPSSEKLSVFAQGENSCGNARVGSCLLPWKWVGSHSIFLQQGGFKARRAHLATSGVPEVLQHPCRTPEGGSWIGLGGKGP